MFDLPCCIVELLQLAIVLGFICFLLLCLVVKATTPPTTNILVFDQEKEFQTGLDSPSVEKFPDIEDKASLDLSVIIPAYNEEERLPVMLEECMDFLQTHRKSGFEVIIVDDGSKDGTSKVGLEYVKKYGCDKIRVLTLAKNRGKGGAVRMGMLRARGKKLLFADADGATKFEDIMKLEDCLERIKSFDDFAIVCGSRAHLEKESIANRTLFRTILMYGFHLCVWLFAVKTVKDTQCGFKMLTRPTARIVFKALHIERWAFDVEMLKIGEMLSIPIGEVSVRWTEIAGSKLDPILASIQMFRDIFLLWLRYAIGAWRLPEKQD